MLKIVEDYTMLKNLEKSKVLVKCNVCGRIHTLCKANIENKQGSKHKDCIRSLDNSIFSSKFYKTWLGVRRRTTNENDISYKNYGGIGISSDKYKYFIDFYDDLYDDFLNTVEKYGDENILSIDRINPYGDYEKENIRWISKKEQNQNRKNNKVFYAMSPDLILFTHNCQSEFAIVNNLKQSEISRCLRKERKTHSNWIFSWDYDDLLSMCDFHKKHLLLNYNITFVAISPVGEYVHFTDVSEFCITNNLDKSKISECLKGNRKSHKKWKFVKK